MTPDPSGAARAPQPLNQLVAQVREALETRELWAKGGTLRECHRIDGDECIPADQAYARQREWLGALVQAVEDQQRVGLCPVCGKPSHSKCNHCGEEFYTYRESLASTNERLAPVVRELKSEVAQLRADGQRLRQALDTIYKIAAGGDVRRTAFEALHPDEAPPSDAP